MLALSHPALASGGHLLGPPPDQVNSPPPDQVNNWNIQADFGAIGGNSVGDAAKFTSFDAAYRAAYPIPVSLTIPAGSYSTWSGVGQAGDNSWLAGKGTLVVNGNGAIVKGIWLGGLGQTMNSTAAALFATVAAGASAITLVNLGDYTKFPVCRWVLLQGIGLQSSGGPSNPFYFEYVKVLSVNSSTGVITFTTPLVNSYKSTWPIIWPGNLAYGGPGIACVMGASWDQDLTINDLTVSQTAWAGVYGSARSVKLNNVTFTKYTPAPSNGLLYEMTDCTVYAGVIYMEPDKLLQQLNMYGIVVQGTNYILFQSSCVQNVLIDQSGTRRSSIPTIQGTPGNIIINNTDITTKLYIGASGYGWAKSVLTDTSSIIAGLSHSTNRKVKTAFTNHTGGVLSLPKSGGPWTNGVPGAKFFYGNSDGVTTFNYGYAFTISDMYDDGLGSGGNFFFQTDAPDTFPTIAGGLATHICPTPCWDCTFGYNAANAPAVNDQATGTAHRPLYEHILRTITTPFSYGGQNIFLWGTLVSIRVKVTQAYTGAQSTLTLSALNSAFVLDPATLAQTTINLTINLKIAGERIFTPSGVTGAQTGDVFPTAKAWWFTKGVVPSQSASTAGDTSGQQAIFEYEFTTSQG